MTIGISKRELLEDYYPDELNAIFGEYNILHQREHDEDVEMGPTEFLGAGGEQVGA